jgi:hypothetical protein
VFSEEMARRLLQAMNEQQATGRTDVDVFLVGARVFRITQKGMVWLETPPPPEV